MKIYLKVRKNGKVLEFENKNELYDYVFWLRRNGDVNLDSRSTIEDILNELPYAEYDRINKRDM